MGCGRGTVEVHRSNRSSSVGYATVRAATLARRYLASRRRRAELLNTAMFADPAWDILLDLFVSAAEGRRVSVSSACLASGVATSTALRWVSQLEREGLIARAPDPHDGRRTFLVLNDAIAIGLERWLNATFVHSPSGQI